MPDLKLIAYCPLHYGGEYLDAAIRAVAPFVEKIVMLYTPVPSYGHNTAMACPESEYDLKNIAHSASSKVEWVTIKNCGYEAHHRNRIFEHSNGYDGVIAFDADEVMALTPGLLQECHHRNTRHVGFSKYINFWKSFNHACYDGFLPVRYYNLHAQTGMSSVDVPVYHFSCAQRLEIMRYKLDIHGHKDEIRPCWLNDIYLNWVPGMKIDKGLHLVSFDLWDASPFDKATMPDVLKQHPNYGKEVIM